jgi:hypothetical protein
MILKVEIVLNPVGQNPVGQDGLNNGYKFAFVLRKLSNEISNLHLKTGYSFKLTGEGLSGTAKLLPGGDI